MCAGVVIAVLCGCPSPEPGTNNGTSSSGGNSVTDAGGIFSGLDAGSTDGSSAGDAGLPDAAANIPDAAGDLPDAAVLPSTVCADVAARKCDFEIRCLTDEAERDGRANNQIAATQRSACEARQAAEIGCVITARGWELERAILDLDAYNRCFNASYPSDTCARDLVTALQECSFLKFVTPNTANGSLCTNDLDCSAGYCSVPGGNACGTCTTWKTDGTACTADTQCDRSASWCDNTRLGASNTCRAYAALDATCDDDEHCGPDNVCAYTGNLLERRCKVGKALGAMCTGGRYECARTAGLVVPDSICSTENGMGTCVSTVTTVGAICGGGERLFFLGPQGPACRETEFCSAALCVPRRTDGQPCTNTDQCAPGHWCDNNGAGATNTCLRYRDVGEACSGNAVCRNYLNCLGATCQPAAAELMEPCNAMVPCVEGYCDTPSGLCQPRKADAVACSADGQCESLDCNNNVCADACWD